MRGSTISQRQFWNRAQPEQAQATLEQSAARASLLALAAAMHNLCSSESLNVSISHRIAPTLLHQKGGNGCLCKPTAMNKNIEF